MDASMEDAAGEQEPLFEDVQQPDEQADAMEVEITETKENGADGKEPELGGEHEWRIENFSTRTDLKVFSEKFELGTYIWRLLTFPRGNNSPYLSVYLDAPEAPWMPQNLTPKASFTLSLVNQKDETKHFTKDTSHTFTSQEADWGFTQFIPLADLDKGFLGDDDSLVLRVKLRIQKDERYCFDSRAETGHVGLKNQGATCYMNSLLQYLFHVNKFRKAVYHMPTEENDDPGNSIPLALQSLFFRLQYSKTPPSTKDLTRSFGWSQHDALYQHDVQELNRVLCEKLEEKMKNTRVEKAIPKLFEGRWYNYVKCINVAVESHRVEPFMDIALDVRGCRDVYASFDKMVEKEVMDGENQYQAEGHGLQDAHKGMLLQDLPPVLQLQLKRFDYDYQKDAMLKINDRYEYPEELDLDREGGKYLAPNADRTIPNKYKLLAVLVHSGGVHGGHYYAFIRPDGKTWLKFDDERVTIESPQKALEDNYGGDGAPEGDAAAGALGVPTTGTGAVQPMNLRWNMRFSNAYMLAYVRMSDWDDIMSNVTKEDIAEHLRKRLEVEQQEKERRQKEKQEAHLYCHVTLARDEDISRQIGSSLFFDLVDYDALTDTSFRIRKHTKFTEFKDLVAEKLGVPVDQQRYWVWQRRQNSTFRPSRRLTPQEEAAQLMDLRDLRETAGPVSKSSLMDIKLYLETPQQPGKPLRVPSRSEILLFLKFYDPSANDGAGSLAYVGRLYVPKASRVRDLHDKMRERAGLAAGTPLLVSEEVKFDPTVMVNELDPNSILGKTPGGKTAELEDGDILCFQDAALVDSAAEGALRHPRVADFLSYISQRKMVTFRQLSEPGEEGLQLELLKDMEYEEVAGRLAEALHVPDPALLRLTQHSHYSSGPQRAPIKYNAPVKLEAMVQHAGHQSDILYYEVLDIPLPELEQLKILRIAWHGPKGEFVADHQVRVPRDSVVKDVLDELRKQLGPDHAQSKLRLLEIYQNKVYKVFDYDDSISSINSDYWHVRAEAVPQEDQDMQESSRMVYCYHIAAPREQPASSGGGGPASPAAAGSPPAAAATAAGPPAAPVIFGDPLLLKIGDSETLASIKARLRARLEVKGDEEWAKWRFGFFTQRAQPEWLHDEDVPAQRFAKASVHVGSDTAYLGMEHDARGAGKRSQGGGNRSGMLEKGIKIAG